MSVQTGSAIIAGYIWRQRLQVTAEAPPFPEGVTLRAQVRKSRAATEELATLTTENGGLVRVDDNSIDIVIAGASSTDWRDSVMLDIVRTDLDDDEHLGIQLTVPVMMPVTWPAA